jgi:hypothetical protein
MSGPMSDWIQQSNKFAIKVNELKLLNMVCEVTKQMDLKRSLQSLF